MLACSATARPARRREEGACGVDPFQRLKGRLGRRPVGNDPPAAQGLAWRSTHSTLCLPMAQRVSQKVVGSHHFRCLDMGFGSV